MPCTQHDDQEQCRRVSFRSAFSRNVEGLRFAEQLNNNPQGYWIAPSRNYAQEHQNNNSHHHNLQVALVPASSHHHSPQMPSSSSLSQNPIQEDVTDQIRISVQEAHLNSARQFANDIGGNLDDVLDSFVENAHNFDENQQFISNNEPSNQVTPTNQQQTPTLSSREDIYAATTSNNSHYLVVSSSAATAAQTERILDEDVCNQLDEDFEKQYESHIKPAEFTSHIGSNNSANNDAHSINSIDAFSSNNLSILRSDLDHKLKLNQNDESNSESILVARKSKDTRQDDDDRPLKLMNTLPPFTHHRQAGSIRNYLYNGSSFSGFQKSKKESYEVNVKIQHVDFENSYLCGYLCINHLTQSHPSLTTFFEGEIISRQYPFFTKKWETTEDIDRAHWSMFEEFERQYSKTFNLDSFDYDELENSDCIYMRWKEHFLVPDHTIKHVEGASYAGFYYICYSKRTSSIRGYYFHINSEHFERLVLTNNQTTHTYPNTDTIRLPG